MTPTAPNPTRRISFFASFAIFALKAAALWAVLRLEKVETKES